MEDELNISTEDIQRLSPNEQRELQLFIQSETQKSQISKSESLIQCRTIGEAVANRMFSFPWQTSIL